MWQVSVGVHFFKNWDQIPKNDNRLLMARDEDAEFELVFHYREFSNYVRVQ